VAAAKLQVEQAKDSLTSAQATKDGQCRLAGFQCQAAQAQAFAAETAVSVANQNLKTLTDPPTQDATNQAQAAVAAAQQAYKLAQNPYTSTDIAQAQAAVDAAQQAYQLAQAPYTDTDVEQAQAAVDAANAQLELAEAPYTTYDVQAAQVAVQQAQAALTIAQTNLKEASVVAPFDGVISAKLLSPGALASPSTPIFTLISNLPQVQFSIEESRIAAIKAGQAVNLSSSAVPGKLFPAQVTSIYPSADPKTHTFTIAVQPQDSSSDLKAGMFVSLVVTVASDPNAILVPNVAVVQQGPQSVVYTVAGGKAHLQAVTIGIADDNNTQIVSGVTAGEEVATSSQSNLTDGSPVRIAGPVPAAGRTPASSASGRPGGSSSRQSGAPTGTGRGATRASPTPKPQG